MKSHWFQTMIDSIAERGRELLGLETNATNKQNLPALCQQLITGQGEASGIALSQEILNIYHNINHTEKLAFFRLLAEAYDPDVNQLQICMDRYVQSHSPQDLNRLTLAIEAPRQELFRRLNMAPHGTASLVGMRGDLLDVLKTNSELVSVDADLKHVLSSWFNRGFLKLHSIDWQSPAHILEKLINYESVHEIQGWHDLRRRLMQDRRCFAFFHPAMPDEPLIFIEVALVQGLSATVHDLIDPDAAELDPKRADAAIFYSINNTQTGLRGISFGNFLIKQVLIELTQECPWIKLTSTLSPMPRFAAMLRKWFEADTPPQVRFEAILQRHSSSLEQLAAQSGIDTMLSSRAVLQALLDNPANMQAENLAAILHELALAYLITPDQNGRLPDPVAMFHLSNGAGLERINTNADLSAHGIASSYGVMVNYLYDLNNVEANHEAFVTKGKVKMSDTLAKLVKQFDRT